MKNVIRATVLAVSVIACGPTEEEPHHWVYTDINGYPCGDSLVAVEETSDGQTIDFRDVSQGSAVLVTAPTDTVFVDGTIQMRVKIEVDSPNQSVLILPVQNNQRMANVVAFSGDDMTWAPGVWYDLEFNFSAEGVDYIRTSDDGPEHRSSFPRMQSEFTCSTVDATNHSPYLAFFGGQAGQQYSITIASLEFFQ